MGNTNSKKQKRNVNSCPLYKKCGGCQLQNMSYEEQLSFKQVKVIKLLGRYHHVNEIIGMDNPYHYRNKVQAAFGMKGGNIISGVYQSSTHKIVPVDSCMIEDEKADEIVVTIRKLLKSFKLKPFNDETMQGFLRHVLIKRSFSTNQIMVVLVTGYSEFPKSRQFINALLERHSDITTIIQNINDKRTSLVLGEKSRVLYGDGYIEDILCGCRFRISAKAFYQINSIQTEKLYNTALKFAKLSGNETVIDAYCGTGTIGIIASKKAGSIIGVELNHDAVEDAKVNAQINNIKNIDFYEADAGKFMVDAAKAGRKADVVIMDPPRAGASVSFLHSLITLSPKKVVYISCNPETQARDISILIRNGYRVRKIQPVDMFPHTEHVETVVQLVRKKPDTYIDITVDMDELDLTSSEAKATYDEIKDYIFDKYSVKVSSLYIAQVKQKHGIIERDCYNNPKKETPKQPQCPPEKVKLIEEALRHFKMIS